MKKLLSVLLPLVLIFSLAGTAMAKSGETTVSITYRGIRIIADGELLDPRDVNGNATEPFILSGTTYLPVRAVASALGLDVQWDETNSTVTLSSGGKKTSATSAPVSSSETKTAIITYRNIKIVIDGKALTPTDATGNSVEPFIMNGTTYLPVRAVANALGLSVGWDDGTSTITLSSGKSDAEKEEQKSAYRLVRSTETWTTYGRTGIDEMEYRYDSADNLVEVEYTSSVEAAYTNVYHYDSENRLISSYEQGMFNITYTYDEAGRLLQVTNDMGDKYGSPLVWTYNYNTDGSVHTKTSSYIYVKSLCYTIEYFYDIEGRLIREEKTYQSGSTDTTLYSYDNAGNLIREESGPDTVTYTYNSQGQLIKRIVKRISPGDNRSKTTAYTYDEHGNLVKEVEDIDDNYHSTTTYEYEPVN